MPLYNAFYRMLVNLHGSLCITVVFYTAMVKEKNEI